MLVQLQAYIYMVLYGIHHWRIVWSSYRKLAWVGFEPTATEFRSDALTDWAIKPWVPTMFVCMYEHNVQSVTSEPSQSRPVSSFKNSLALLKNWGPNFTKVKSFLPLGHCLWWKPKIYTGTQSKFTKRWEQGSSIKQLLETLFFAIKMCTGYTTNGICLNTMCAVPLANRLRFVNYLFISNLFIVDNFR